MNLQKKYISLLVALGVGKVRRNTDPFPIMNVNYNPCIKQKKVLICYFDLNRASHEIEAQGGSKQSGAIHTNRFEFFEIVKCFIKLDSCIDIVLHDDVAGLKCELLKREYDIIFGLGETFRLTKELFPDAFRILYMTENPYRISYERECERIRYFKERHNKSIPLYRTGMFFKKDEEKFADAIFCVGDETYYNDLMIPVKRILPSAFLPAERPNFTSRVKNSFVIFGTDGMVHKGVDIVYEVFAKHPEWELFLCGYEVTKGLNRLGYKKIASNVHDMGYVIPRSNTFDFIMSRASHVLLLSSSEGTSTGILTCMAQGLIPIVTKGNGCEIFSDMCIFCEDYSVEAVEKLIFKTLENRWEDTCARFEEIYDYAMENFKLSDFSYRFEAALKDLIQKMKL